MNRPAENAKVVKDNMQTFSKAPQSVARLLGILICAAMSVPCRAQGNPSHVAQALTGEQLLRAAVGTWKVSFNTADSKRASMLLAFTRSEGTTIEGFTEWHRTANDVLRMGLWGSLNESTGRLVLSALEIQTTQPNAESFCISAILSADARELTLGIDEVATWSSPEIPPVPAALAHMLHPASDRSAMYQQLSWDYVSRRTTVEHWADRNRVVALSHSQDPHVRDLARGMMSGTDSAARLRSEAVLLADDANESMNSDVAQVFSEIGFGNGSPLVAIVEFLNSPTLRRRFQSHQREFAAQIVSTLSNAASCMKIRTEQEKRLEQKVLPSVIGRAYKIDEVGFPKLSLTNRSKETLTNVCLIVQTHVDPKRLAEHEERYNNKTSGLSWLEWFTALGDARESDRAFWAYHRLDKTVFVFVPKWSSNTPIEMSLGIPGNALRALAHSANVWIACDEGIQTKELDIEALRALAAGEQSKK